MSTPSLLLALAACHSGTDPAPAIGEAVLVVGGEGDRLALVDGTAGRVVARPGPVARTKSAAALAPDGSVAYLSLLGASKGNELAALEPRSGRFRWRLALTDPGSTATRVGGFLVYGSALGVSPDGARIFLGNALRPEDQAHPLDSARVAVLDAATRRLVGTLGPLSVMPDGLATLPAGPAAPHGAVLAVAARRRGVSPSLDWLFVIDPATLAVVDSAAVTAPADDAGGTLRRLVVAPDGRRVYLVSRGGGLVAYDPAARAVVGRAQGPEQAWLAVAPDGQRLYASDPGTFAAPGGGRVLVFGPELQSLGAIDLSAAAAVDGVPPSTHGLAVSRDGARLYVAAGTASAGGYPAQPQRLLVVDVAQGTLGRAVALDDYGPARVYVP
ncbi:MAG: YncE family protein [Gemmatimonadaceae bacterium]